MSSPLVDIRNEVYTRILTLKGLSSFSFNDFGLKKAWKPYTSIEEMNVSFPGGIVTVVGGLMGDRNIITRNGRTVLAEFSVKIGYQKYITDDIGGADTSPIDDLVNFVEELDEVCRNRVDLDNVAYLRTEFLKDENGIPFHFIRAAQLSTFEAFFDAYYNFPINS